MRENETFSGLFCGAKYAPLRGFNGASQGNFSLFLLFVQPGCVNLRAEGGEAATGCDTGACGCAGLTTMIMLAPIREVAQSGNLEQIARTEKPLREASWFRHIARAAL